MVYKARPKSRGDVQMRQRREAFLSSISSSKALQSSVLSFAVCTSFIRALFVGAWLLTLIPSTAMAKTISGSVRAVIDGDSFWLKSDSNALSTIRLAGVDCPEKTQSHWQDARDNLTRLVLNKSVTIEYEKRDYQGRAIGKVLHGNVDLSLEQLKAGLAEINRQYLYELSNPDAQSYQRAEAESRSKRLGIWSDPDLEPPWIWRLRKQLSQLTVPHRKIGDCLIVGQSTIPSSLPEIRFFQCDNKDPLSKSYDGGPETNYLYEQAEISNLLLAFNSAERGYCGLLNKHCITERHPLLIVIKDDPLPNAYSRLNRDVPYIQITTGLLLFAEHASWAVLGDSADSLGLSSRLVEWKADVRRLSGEPCQAREHIPLPDRQTPTLTKRLVARAIKINMYRFIFAHELAHLRTVSSGGNCNAPPKANSIQVEESCDVAAFDAVLSDPFFPNSPPRNYLTLLTMMESYELLAGPSLSEANQLPLPWEIMYPAADWRVRGLALTDHWEHLCETFQASRMCKNWQERVWSTDALLEMLPPAQCHEVEDDEWTPENHVLDEFKGRLNKLLEASTTDFRTVRHGLPLRKTPNQIFVDQYIATPESILPTVEFFEVEYSRPSKENGSIYLCRVESGDELDSLRGIYSSFTSSIVAALSDSRLGKPWNIKEKSVQDRFQSINQNQPNFEASCSPQHAVINVWISDSPLSSQLGEVSLNARYSIMFSVRRME